MFRLAYNTNGLAHHRLLDAFGLLADLGYEGVSITPDVGQLDLFSLAPGEVETTRRRADDLGLELSIETGARFVLDAERKHYPTLLEDSEPARARRVDFYRRSIDLAHELGAQIVSLWAGRAPTGVSADRESGDSRADDREIVWERLTRGLTQVLDYAATREVQIAFEPEPGMFIERPAGYGELVERLGPDGDTLGLCLDVGHLLVTGDLPVGAVIREWAPRLVHVHLDDIAEGLHEHRMFGEGDLDLAETLGSLLEIGFDGLAAIELSRDSHRGAQAAQEALAHVRNALSRPG